MMFYCPKKESCINYKVRCFNCGAIADELNLYPRYIDREDQKRKLRTLLVNVPEVWLVNEQLTDIVDYLIENGVVVREE